MVHAKGTWVKHRLQNSPADSEVWGYHDRVCALLRVAVSFYLPALGGGTSK